MCSTIPKYRHSNKKPHTPFWNDECTQIIKLRTTAENRMKRTKNLADAIEYYRIKIRCKHVIEMTGKSFGEKFCSNLNYSSRIGSVWKTIKLHLNRNVQPSRNVIQDGIIVTAILEKTNIFSSELEKYSNIVVAQDPHFFLIPYFQLHNMPFLAFYDKKKQFISVHEGSMPIGQVIDEIKK